MAGSPQEKYHFRVLCLTSRIATMPPDGAARERKPQQHDLGGPLVHAPLLGAELVVDEQRERHEVHGEEVDA